MPPSLDSQGLLFERAPDAAAVLRGPDEPPEETVRLLVHRNLAIEHSGSFAEGFSRYAGTGLELSYSDYDDTLSSIDSGSDAEVHLVALDASRYEGNREAFRSWLGERVEAFRAALDAPLLLLSSPEPE